MLIAIFAITFIFLISFFNINACMDAGGAWADFGFTCIQPREGFVPQYMRPVLGFWILIVAVTSMLTLIVSKILTKLRAG